MRKSLPIIALLSASIALTGCTANKATTGALVGAIAGAAAGKSTGNHKTKRAFIGAAIGALAGGAVGSYMDNQEQAFRDELAGSGIEIVREGDQIRLILPSNVTFASNQSNISPNFHTTLDAVAKVMNRYEKTYLGIDGYTDSTGDPAYNILLSEKRAESVKSFLVRQGVMAKRIQVTGFGATQPIASNDTPAGRAKNRRVEINIIPNQA